MKKEFKILLALAMAGVFALNRGEAAVSVGAVNNSSVGYWVSSSGAQLTSGGISVGYFTGTPDWVNLKTLSASLAWDALINAGFVDLRTVSGITQPTDWSFASGGTPVGTIGGTAGNIPIATLPSNTRLYAIAFDSGSWNANNTMASATFGGTEWGAVSASGHATATENWVSPADLGSKSLQFKSSNLVATDVLVGSLASNYATTFNVQLIPEPSTTWLTISGLFAIFACRKSRNKGVVK